MKYAKYSMNDALPSQLKHVWSMDIDYTIRPVLKMGNTKKKKYIFMYM